ncbi:MAG: AI-2E family transporter [Arenicellales bacterium]|jgi:putative permease|nr:AI-2E family transporter [Acidiferrobacter sp.]MED5249042.1 AI-2E family transporter [Pseudomonadota bacterium]HAA35857.1 AI-2E family transporter [Gammaproteobacteria bacterium]|tara:strand:+ start:236 stop:1294 length:1059 start_codon:yes stop_codon:yes gene_type:complete
MKMITDWFRYQFNNPQVVFLTLFLVLLFVVVVLMGNMLAPLLAAVVIAYLLEGLVGVLEKTRLPRLIAVLVVYFAFLLFVVLILFGLLPLLSQQATQFVQQIPSMLNVGQDVLLKLPESYPEIVSAEQIGEIMVLIRTELTSWGQKLLSVSLASVMGLITILIYLILMPILIFFMMKDKEALVAWVARFAPSEHQLVGQVWSEVDRQIGNYVRGKFWEIVIVWFACVVTFSVLGLQYTMLLAVLVGLSVLIPFVGAAVVTIPVVFVAWFQWGFTGDFFVLVSAYLIIQALDGNLLVPMLFSEVNNLHPVAIIAAVLIFGGLWGVLGVFFAIPLATLVHAVINAWPRETEDPV